MPRENSRNSVKKRNDWDETNMKRAIEAVKNNEMGYLRAAKVFDVPKSTLFRFITQGIDSSQSGLRRKLGKKPILSLELENKLVKYVLEMEPIFHGITKGDLRSMAYQLVTQNGLKNPFHDGKAGREWLHKFLNRHKDELYGRKPTETSCIWSAGFTKENVNAFFDLLEKAFDEYDYPRDRVYTVDETGLLIVQKKIPRVVGLKGLRQTGGLTSAERDAFVTIISCMSAAGHYVPPMMIFPQTKISHELMKGAPTGAIGVCHPSGWIEINIFTQWFRHFLQQTKPSANSPVLLLLDGHYSHTKSIEVIDLARENHVRIICFPPRCTDKLQPLHKTFMGELKSRYGEQVCLFLNCNKRPVSSCDIAELFAKAYLKVQTREIAEKGFEKAGIFPVDRFVLSDFLAVEESGEKKKCANNFLYCMSCTPENNKTEEENIDENRSDTSESDIAEPLFINLQGEPSEDKPCTSYAIINTEENERKRERKIGETCLDSENELTNESDVNIFKSDYTCDTNEELMHNNSENQNAECIFCLGKYSENQKREEWVRCTQCELWAHRACAGADKSVYTCDFCETLIQGDNTAGFSIFWADDGLDTGPILLQKSCKVEANDTVDSLYNNFLYPEGIKAMGEAVDLVAKGTAPMVPQPAEGATYDPLLNKKELQKIDWTKPAKEIHDFIRGLDSTPGALTMLDGEEVRLFGSSLSNDKQPEVKKIVKEVRLFGSSVSNDKQPEVKKIVERKGIVHQGGLLIEAVDGRFVNVERIKIGTKTILASKYGQIDDSKVVEFTEEELKTADGLRRIWADILRIDVNDDTDFFASGGGSMDVVRLVEEVKDNYGVSLQNSDVFMASVFKEFAATVVLTARGNLAAKEIKYDAVEVQANTMTLRFPRQIFIDGQFVNGHGNPVDTINPHDESVICSVESANAEDVDLAVRAAKKAFEEGEWGKISARERGALLFRLADLMEEHKEELATLETLDSGAVYTLALKTHIGMSIETWRYFAGWCDKIHGSTIPISHARPNRNLTFTRREPIGVCGLVTPWNYPLMMLSWKMAVCLAAGNTVVMKPAQASPLTALKFAELSARAGIPHGVINIVCGFGSAVGNAIVGHPLIRKLGFTGSTQVGQAIMRCCADSNLKKVSLELGGKSPLVIFEDADLQQAVRIGMGSVFFNKGENCIAAGRLFVEETIHDEFVRRVVDEVKKITIGNPLDRSTAHGPQNHKAHLDKLLQFVQKGVKEGAKLVYGGKRLNRPGWYFEPTVFTDVEDDMYIAKEESFGPVMVISKFSSKNVDQMIARANNTEFGLASGVLTKDISRALRFAEKIEAGTVFINTYNKTDVAAPFGGFKMSGFGKDLGQEALNEYLKTKTVTIEY